MLDNVISSLNLTFVTEHMSFLYEEKTAIPVSKIITKRKSSLNSSKAVTHAMKLNVVSLLPTIFIGAYKIRCLKNCQSNFITVAKLINLTDENVPIIVNGFNAIM